MLFGLKLIVLQDLYEFQYYLLSGLWGSLFPFSIAYYSDRSSGTMAMFGKVLEPVGYMQTVRSVFPLYQIVHVNISFIST